MKDDRLGCVSIFDFFTGSGHAIQVCLWSILLPCFSLPLFDVVKKKICDEKSVVLSVDVAVNVDCLLVRSGGSDRCFTLPLVCIGSGV
jgi:hypothetical protein